MQQLQDEDFIYNLLLEAGYSPDKDDFDVLKEEIEPLLMDKIISRVFEELSNEQRKEVMKLFDAKKEAEEMNKKMEDDEDDGVEFFIDVDDINKYKVYKSIYISIYA